MLAKVEILRCYGCTGGKVFNWNSGKVFNWNLHISLYKHELAQCRQECDTLRAQLQLVSTWTHDIRTPLGAILGFSQLLRNTELTETQRKYVEMEHHYGEQLLHIINTILDFIRVETGTISLQKDDFDIRQCLEHAVAQVQQMVSSHDTTIAYHEDPAHTMPTQIVHDEYQIERMMTLWMLAALHVTRARDVAVSIYHEPDAEPPYLRLCLTMSVQHVHVANEDIQQFQTRIEETMEFVVLSRLSRLLEATIELPRIQDNLLTFVCVLPYQSSV